MDFLKELISGSVFMPHGMCFRWTLPLLELHVVSDALIAIAYASLPVTLFWLVRKKRDIPFNWMFVLFLVFIMFCGIYHLLEIVTLWYPIYWVSGINKLILAVGSIMTAILLTRLIPRALALPSPQALAEANANLSHTNENLRLLSDHLGQVRDQALKASKLKSQFLANTSHEFRTPIAGVLGMAELLQETELSTEQQEILQAVEVSGQTLLTTINNVLVFSRIEAGKLKIESVPFSLHWLLRSTINQVTPGASKKGISITTNIDPNISPVLKGDPERFGQVINNLLDNSVHFANHKQITLTVTLASHDLTSEVVLIEIQSRGMNLAGGDQLSLLEMPPSLYPKDTDTSSELISCANLGLSICKKLAELMGGEIGAKNDTATGASILWCRVKLIKITDPEELANARSALLPELMISNPGTSEEPAAAYSDSHATTGDTIPSIAGLTMSGSGVSGARSSEYRNSTSDLHPADTSDALPAAKSDIFSAATSDVLPAAAAYVHPAATSDILPSATSDILPAATSDIPTAATSDILPAAGADGAQAVTASATSDVLQATQSTISTKSAAAAADALAQIAAANIARGPVLVVDDSRVQRDILLSQLLKLGITTDSACNGQEAVEMATKREYSLILMDCQMPELDGCSASAKIRQTLSTGGKRPVIIGMTASSESDDHARCLEAGMDDALIKPVSLDQLRKLLQGGH